MNLPAAASEHSRVSMRDRMAMYNDNVLKIGLFGSNCSSGRAVTRVPERWSGNWEDNLALARMADDAGIDFILPVGRWKGYGGDTDYMGTTLETITWATGLLAHTKRLIAFGTVHAPLFHPLIAAKQFVTADQVSGGRFGLNVVVGWNEDEFQMFGVTQREHEQRYDYAQEWLDAVKLAWGPKDDFDYDGRFLKLKNVRAKPKPYGGSRPLIMNAGASPAGRAFAIRNCDAFFTQASLTSIEETAGRVKAAKDDAAAQGRELDVYAVGVVTCRPTQKEAEEYYNYATIENADWSAVDGILGKKNISPATVGEEEFQKQRHHYAHGLGGLLMVGDPDRIAGQLADLSRAGLRGIGFSFVNYLKELPYFCDEVLPRLERLGIRQKRA
ncbi:LLM class flavin-dependent oxidoreductase [Pseudorhodoplanes sp.]|jgi:alkanesulfonate monooxygenase SsuD/methylene tetrahydromethanopterin reductase-like flavin-dependent oxidoreductase (luciferase family)|uniref:LLM class flavin-dependent oxidoreductase n=1 Tax=Pseudorhodoplanes sp. TaxID=1934341 RepID=UPI002C5855F5|nr:LLM class flavin-dependent oxidoreductase [Pseudorhodoplanes sp.]HWL31649.1 LLM class flavin-dependent oxidoreductase [Xanthobacteraceae bacterium]HWV43128.1 LLM class flavin-dependent oxidoreductase [Pseudorhodoplanes sp.]